MSPVKARPKFLNVVQIRLPVVAVLSILHRISGVLLLLAALAGVALLQLSVGSSAGFEEAGRLLGGWPGRLTLALVTWAFAHHFFAGLRFLLIDIDIAVDKFAARRTAWITIGLAVVPALWVMLAGGAA